MRIVLSCCLTLLVAQMCQAQEPTRETAARDLAESMIAPSGPLRAPATADYTPDAWRARRAPAGTYADQQARHRFTRHTYGWPTWYGWGAYVCGPYRCWHWWRGGW